MEPRPTPSPIGLFAIKDSTKSKIFCSKAGQNPGLLLDSFPLQWSRGLLCAFLLLPVVIVKIWRQGHRQSCSLMLAEAVLSDKPVTDVGSASIPARSHLHLISQHYSPMLHSNLELQHLKALLLAGSVPWIGTAPYRSRKSWFTAGKCLPGRCIPLNGRGS